MNKATRYLCVLTGGLVLLSTSLTTVNASSSSYLTKQNVISWNGKKLLNTQGLLVNGISYLSIGTIGQILKGIGISNTWDGKSFRISVANYKTEFPSWVDLTHISAGQGKIGIYLNDTLVRRVSGIDVTGPSKQSATYIPIQDMMNVLRRANIESNWNGATWELWQGVKIGQINNGAVLAAAPNTPGIQGYRVSEATHESDLGSPATITLWYFKQMGRSVGYPIPNGDSGTEWIQYQPIYSNGTLGPKSMPVKVSIEGTIGQGSKLGSNWEPLDPGTSIYMGDMTYTSSGKLLAFGWKTSLNPQGHVYELTNGKWVQHGKTTFRVTAMDGTAQFLTSNLFMENGYASQYDIDNVYMYYGLDLWMYTKTDWKDIKLPVQTKDFRYFFHGQRIDVNPNFKVNFVGSTAVSPSGQFAVLTNDSIHIYQDGSWTQIPLWDSNLHLDLNNSTIRYDKNGDLLVNDAAQFWVYHQNQWYSLGPSITSVIPSSDFINVESYEVSPSGVLTVSVNGVNDETVLALENGKWVTLAKSHGGAASMSPRFDSVLYSPKGQLTVEYNGNIYVYKGTIQSNGSSLKLVNGQSGQDGTSSNGSTDENDGTLPLLSTPDEGEYVWSNGETDTYKKLTGTPDFPANTPTWIKDLDGSWEIDTVRSHSGSTSISWLCLTYTQQILLNSDGSYQIIATSPSQDGRTWDIQQGNDNWKATIIHTNYTLDTPMGRFGDVLEVKEQMSGQKPLYYFYSLALGVLLRVSPNADGSNPIKQLVSAPGNPQIYATLGSS